MVNQDSNNKKTVNNQNKIQKKYQMKKLYLMILVALFTTLPMIAEESESFVFNEESCVDAFIEMTSLHGSLIALASQNRKVYSALQDAQTEIPTYNPLEVEHTDGIYDALIAARTIAERINATEYEKTKTAYETARKNVEKCLKKNLVSFVTKAHMENLQW